jgi:hypothetical protein
MDLPFAVDSGDASSLQQSNTSLVTASSQGSYLQADEPDDFYVHQSETTAATTPIFDDAFDNHDEHGQSIIMEPDMEVIDFTQYVTVSENDASEVDVVINHPGPQHGASDLEQQQQQQGDVLSLLLSGNTGVVTQAEEANRSAHVASESKANGNLAAALYHHSLAAKGFRAAALEARPKDVALSNSLLLLSQSQAKSALALKEFLKKHEGNSAIISSALTQKERLRATVRGALVTNKEADISDSMFLGTAKKGSGPSSSLAHEETKHSDNPSRYEEEKSEAPSFASNSMTSGSKTNNNPVDEMLELERELKDMDAALELGNSVASLGTRAQNRLKQSTMDGSFMVVPPGSSYMSSSAMWSRPQPRVSNKANRVQTMLGASATAAPLGAAPNTSHSMAAMIAPPPQRSTSNTALDASWWGNASTTSQVLAGSVVSIASSSTRHNQVESTNTKQLMRLLDSIKTLGDENAALLREVEEAEAARMEAKAAREQMRKFKAEYGTRFNSLKSALEKFRTNYSQHQDDSLNPVTVSDYLQSSSNTPSSFASLSSSSSHTGDDHQQQAARQEQLIRKLTADLKREKDESKKKDAALRKYESFYREVKARSAQKAAQRQVQQKRRTTTNSNAKR